MSEELLKAILREHYMITVVGCIDNLTKGELFQACEDADKFADFVFGAIEYAIDEEDWKDD